MLSLFVAFLFDLSAGSLSLQYYAIGQIPLRYPLLVADLVADQICGQVSDKFVYASATSSRFFGVENRSQTVRDSSNLVADPFAAGFRPAFDRPATRTRHAHTGLRPGRRPGLRLDSVMEFGQ